MAAVTVKLERARFDRLFWALPTFLSLLTLLLFRFFLIRFLSAPAVHSWFVVAFLFVVIVLGIVLPRWSGFAAREKRARQGKAEEKEEWGFHGRDREGPWVNYVDHPVVRRTDCAKRRFFYSEWLIIHDGLLIVNPGRSSVHREANGDRTVRYDFSVRKAYAWDGCTPKWRSYPHQEEGSGQAILRYPARSGHASLDGKDLPLGGRQVRLRTRQLGRKAGGEGGTDRSSRVPDLQKNAIGSLAKVVRNK